MNKTRFTLFLMLSTTLAGCQNYYLSKPNAPTEAALVAESYANGMSAEIDTEYLQAYDNLRQAYRRYIGFTRVDDLVFTENKLEPHLEMGTLFARTGEGAYVHKTTIEKMAEHRTRITLFVPKSYPFPKVRFKQDLLRAQGKDPQCNV